MGLVGSPGFFWVFAGFLGFFRFFEVPKDFLCHIGYIWVHLGFHGYMWVPVGSCGLVGSLGVFLDSYGFMKF